MRVEYLMNRHHFLFSWAADTINDDIWSSFCFLGSFPRPPPLALREFLIPQANHQSVAVYFFPGQPFSTLTFFFSSSLLLTVSSQHDKLSERECGLHFLRYTTPHHTPTLGMWQVGAPGFLLYFYFSWPSLMLVTDHDAVEAVLPRKSSHHRTGCLPESGRVSRKEPASC